MIGLVFKIDKHKVIIYGYFGHRLKKAISNHYTKGLVNNIFDTLTYARIEFYEFFSLEVFHIFQSLIDLSPYGVNVRTLKKINNLLEEKTWLNADRIKDTKQLDKDAIKDLMYFDILPHQLSSYDYYDEIIPRYGLKGALLHAAAGSGKTFMSLSLSEMLHANRIVVICPKAAINTVWADSIENTLYKVKQSYWTSDMGSSYNDARIAVYHYEALPQAIKDYKRLKTNRTVLILDESHNLNERNTKRTQLFKQLADLLKTDDILLLSGTPVKALGLELVPILSLLDPLFTTPVRSRFEKAFRGNSESKLELIKSRLGIIRHLIEKKDFQKEKPITNSIKVKIPNGKDYTLDSIKIKMVRYIEDRKKHYDENFETYVGFYNYILEIHSTRLTNKKEFNNYKSNIDKIIKNYNNGTLMQIPAVLKEANDYENNVIIPTLEPDNKKKFRDAKSVVKYLNLKIQGECLGNVITRARIDCHKDMAKEIDYKSIIDSTIKKTVIFTNYVDVAKECEKKLIELEYKPIGVYGNTTTELTNYVNIFMTNKDINPLVASYKSLSTAVPLIAANVMIAIDMPFRTYVYEQATSRLDRLGQDMTVHIYQPELDTGDDYNINSRNIDIILWSKNQVESITGVKYGYDILSPTLSTEDDFKNILNDFIPPRINRDNKEVISSYSKW